MPICFVFFILAGYLTDWPGPAPEERPSAYIEFLNDTAISGEASVHIIDLGLAALNIVLGAREMGFGACLL